MNISIRMIGIATTVFWVFLLAFAFSAVYSVKDVQFHFGEPQVGVNADNQLYFSLPISLANRGFYNIGHFNVTSRILDVNGSEIAHGSTFVRVINKGEEVTAFHNMTLDISDLLQRSQFYLFNDSDLTVREWVGLWLAEVIPVQASTNFTLPWGAPLYNFSVGQTTVSFYNVTHSRIAVPIGFENHALFDVVGAFQINVYNGDMLNGEGRTDVAVLQHNRYDGLAEVYVRNSPAVTTSGRVEIYFSSSVFNYGPWVIPYG